MSDEEIQNMRERLAILETQVGTDAGDGIRGDLKTIKATLDALQYRFALIWGVGLAAVWGLNHFVP